MGILKYFQVYLGIISLIHEFMNFFTLNIYVSYCLDYKTSVDHILVSRSMEMPFNIYKLLGFILYIQKVVGIAK